MENASEYIKTTLSIVLKILLACCSIGVGIFLAKFLIFPSIHSFFAIENPHFKIIEQVTTLILIGFCYWLYVKWYEKRLASELEFRGLDMLYGALSGAVLISITSLLLFNFGFYEVVSVQGFSRFGIVASTILLAAMLEEFLFRAVLFRIIEEKIGTTYALTFVATLFGALHLFNSNTTMMTGFSVTLLGVFWIGIYVLSRNVWVVGLNHAAWNLAIFSTGIPLSGNDDWRTDAPLESVYNGPSIMTGGEFGPEDSIINIIVLLIACAVIYYMAFKNQAIVKYTDCVSKR